jgi:hypothetical protein
MSQHLPVIHSNGTSAETLCEDYLRARRAVIAAMEALSQVEFNARDYYPLVDLDRWSPGGDMHDDSHDETR